MQFLQIDFALFYVFATVKVSPFLCHYSFDQPLKLFLFGLVNFRNEVFLDVV